MAGRMSVVREACLHPRPGVICSQGGHLISGQMAKAFSSANFFNVGVAEVNSPKQWTTVTRMRSNGCTTLRESKCGDFRGAKTAWRTHWFRPAGLTLGGMEAHSRQTQQVDAPLKETMPELFQIPRNQEPRHCLVVCSRERHCRKCGPQWPAI